MKGCGFVAAGKNRLEAKKRTARTTQNRRNAPAGVLKKLMALRGFIIVIVLWIWFNRFSGRGSNGRNWLNRVRVENHKEIILDGHIVARAVGRAGDGKISRGFRVGRHNAAGIADGLRISPFADAERKSIGRVAKFVGGFIGHAYAKDERVFGIESKCLHDSYRVVG